MASLPPVIAIDGPSASGKGTVAALVAARLGFHYLDSGALYRLVALAALRGQVSLDDEARLADLARHLDVRFDQGEVWLGGDLVSDALRSEQAGTGASLVARFGAVREALQARLRAFRQAPGLVADGRDMGSVVFPDAALKIFLTAGVEVRADRRYKQLIEKGMSATLDNLLEDLRQRDLRDSTREVAPLVCQPDAVLLDTSQMGIADAVSFVLEEWQARVSGCAL